MKLFRTSSTALLSLLPFSGVALGHRAHSTCPKYPPEIEEMYKGNLEFMATMAKDNPGLLTTLATEGQKPPFMLFDCSDSRVNEQGIFSAEPGTMFTAGNIANRFDDSDLNSHSALAFAVETLRVKHVIVMGHYGCGGVAASMMPVTSFPKRAADAAVHAWIAPIRKIYKTSTRREIAAHREKTLLNPLTELPDLHDPAFRALVEENVKSNVQKIAKSAVITDHYLSDPSNSTAHENGPYDPDQKDCNTGNRTTTSATGKPVTEVFIHGWVYDVENGRVYDLGVSVGPPRLKGAVPPSPFPNVTSSE